MDPRRLVQCIRRVSSRKPPPFSKIWRLRRGGFHRIWTESQDFGGFGPKFSGAFGAIFSTKSPYVDPKNLIFFLRLRRILTSIFNAKSPYIHPKTRFFSGAFGAIYTLLKVNSPPQARKFWYFALQNEQFMKVLRTTNGLDPARRRRENFGILSVLLP